MAKLEAEADTSDTPKRTCLTCLTRLEVKNYYREGQNPFDYGGPGTQILDTLEFPVRKEGESKMECLWRFPRFFLQRFGHGEVQELQADLLLP